MLFAPPCCVYKDYNNDHFMELDIILQITFELLLTAVDL